MSEINKLLKKLIPEDKHSRKIVTTLAIVFIFVSLFTGYRLYTTGRVLGIELDEFGFPTWFDSVSIFAEVKGCEVDLELIPEKRIPPVDNWGTEIEVQVFDLSNNYRGSFTGDTNDFGRLIANICEQGLELEPGTYQMYAKGKSHLRKSFGERAGFATAGTNLDLSENKSNLLVAGETSVVFDNYINTLDLSTQIAALESTDERNDLNQDGEVNVLDLSVTLVNLFSRGDCSPKDQADGICEPI